MTWGVQTAFDKAIYAGGFGETDSPESTGIHDYKWIKFAINEDYGQDDELFVKYPGDQNYKGGKNQPSGYDGHAGHSDARLLDVHQLLQRLKQEYEEGKTTGTVTVTAFIDEYVYVREPDDPNTDEDNTRFCRSGADTWRPKTACSILSTETTRITVPMARRAWWKPYRLSSRSPYARCTT